MNEDVPPQACSREESIAEDDNETRMTRRVRTCAVYIMASGSGVLYIGVTNDLGRRVLEHRQRRIPGFSARYNIRRLVCFEWFDDPRAAIRREKQLKGWIRKRKVALIESMNPRWEDLSAKL